MGLCWFPDLSFQYNVQLSACVAVQCWYNIIEVVRVRAVGMSDSESTYICPPLYLLTHCYSNISSVLFSTVSSTTWEVFGTRLE